jgi:hypothetical protein
MLVFLDAGEGCLAAPVLVLPRHVRWARTVQQEHATRPFAKAHSKIWLTH